MRILIVPAAGGGTRFKAAGYETPKPFIPIGHPPRPMVLRAIDSFVGKVDRIYGVFDRAHSNHVVELLTQNHPAFGGFTNMLHISERTQGAAMTILSCIGHIPDDAEIFIVNSDQIFDDGMITNWVIQITKNRPLGSMLLFAPATGDPRWSYARLNGYDEVIEVREKQPISNWATCGAYYVRSFAEARDAICAMVAAGDLTNNEYYVAPLFNYLKRGRIDAFFVGPDQFSSVGTPELLRAWETRDTAE